jgi:hypothetical protein
MNTHNGGDCGFSQADLASSGAFGKLTLTIKIKHVRVNNPKSENAICQGKFRDDF